MYNEYRRKKRFPFELCANLTGIGHLVGLERVTGFQFPLRDKNDLLKKGKEQSLYSGFSKAPAASELFQLLASEAMKPWALQSDKNIKISVLI